VNTIDKYYIHRETESGTQINDRKTATKNKIFNALVIKNKDRHKTFCINCQYLSKSDKGQYV
jgi:hypothetical protein